MKDEELKNILDWIHDDITWCGSPCENTGCFRNLANRRSGGMFSMSLLRDTDLCPLNNNKLGRE